MNRRISSEEESARIQGEHAPIHRLYATFSYLITFPCKY
jgi:hypothetical protein